MMLLLCFDLPRLTKKERKEANKFRKHLISLGFSMKQFSLYERPIQRMSTRDKLLTDIKAKVPATGQITVYELPDSVNDSQITLLGKDAIRKSFKKPKLIVF